MTLQFLSRPRLNGGRLTPPCISVSVRDTRTQGRNPGLPQVVLCKFCRRQGKCCRADERKGPNPGGARCGPNTSRIRMPVKHAPSR
jgi:hypothetical protein